MPEKSSHKYVVVDVFAERALEGNPLAVFLDGSGLDGETMQRIAKELNLSETVFLLPPTKAEYAMRLRIFTPNREMLFAGHPTVGASFVLLEHGLVPPTSAQFVLEEKIGPVPVRIERGDRLLLWLTTPPIERGETFPRAICADVLGLADEDLLPPEPQLLSAGNPTIFVALKDKAAVDRASLELAGLQRLKKGSPEFACLFVFAPTPSGAYSRMFAPEYGISEDPATGSSTGPLAAYMIQHGLVSTDAGTQFISEQGTKMGRRSILHVRIHGERGMGGIEVGGHVVPLADAVMHI